MKRLLVMAHMGGKDHGQENSVEAVTVAQHYCPDIIELDVRKSSDGILYCHHGSVPFGMLFAFFFRFFKFSQISKWTNANTLEEALAAIKGNPIIFLDLRGSMVEPRDLDTILSKFSFAAVWLASRSFAHIRLLKNFFGERFLYVYNLAFLRFNFSMKRAKKEGINIFQIFFWQCTQENINAIKKSGMDYAVCSFFQSRKQYIERAKQWNSLWIYYDDLAQIA